MGRYVILLLAPVVLGFVIAVAVVVAMGWRQHRLDAREALLDAIPPDDARAASAPTVTEEPSELPLRRKAS
jgi:hypothetical protein